MKIALLGATGKTGLAVLEQGLKQGHSFKVLARNPSVLQQKLSSIGDQSKLLEVVQGDAMNGDRVDELLKDQDVAIVTLGGRPECPQICSQAQPLINHSAIKNQVKRVIVITSYGCGETIKEAGFLTRVFINTVIKSAIVDKNLQEDLLKTELAKKDGAEGGHSGSPDWVIVRPTGLTDAQEPSTKYRALEKGISGGRISRADVAHFILRDCLTGDQWKHKAVSLAY